MADIGHIGGAGPLDLPLRCAISIRVRLLRSPHAAPLVHDVFVNQYVPNQGKKGSGGQVRVPCPAQFGGFHVLYSASATLAYKGRKGVNMSTDLRNKQQPLKAQYRANPESARITLEATGTQTDAPISCNVDLGRALYAAQAHPGVGGEGTGACSGDLLLGTLAACAQITIQMVASSMGIQTERIQVTVSGDLDLKGTLGIDHAAPVGFTAIRMACEIVAPTATPEQRAALQEKAERYCVVYATLRHPPVIETTWQS